MKNTAAKPTGRDDYDSAIKQILSKAIVSDRVIDVFAAAGLKKPDISILSEEFLAEVKEMPQKNLAFEMLKKLLNDEIKFRQKKKLIQARSFEELLDKAIKAYTNKSIETAQVIEALIELAKKMREEQNRGKKLNLTDDEVAFYDALADNESARQVLGDETLKTIARELVDTVRKNVSIDWTIRESSGKTPSIRQKSPKRIRLPARQAGESYRDSVEAGKAVM
jgi:type I restriction enzyme R subunit